MERTQERPSDAEARAAAIRRAAGELGIPVVTISGLRAILDALPVVEIEYGSFTSALARMRPKAVYLQVDRFDVAAGAAEVRGAEDGDEPEPGYLNRLLVRWGRYDGEACGFAAHFLVDGALHGTAGEDGWLSEFREEVEAFCLASPVHRPESHKGQAGALGRDRISRIGVDGTAPRSSNGPRLSSGPTPRPTGRRMRPRAARSGDPAAVTNHVVFHNVGFGHGVVVTGWRYASKTGRAPAAEYCCFEARSAAGVARAAFLENADRKRLSLPRRRSVGARRGGTGGGVDEVPLAPENPLKLAGNAWVNSRRPRRR